eukprot:TRINITY_DN9016_c0_g2_i1.p1 TRINITY_DN9016_c0_g2~~TRINITY_DN9016_c0_g2_i1.p1  ORF type:complete len:497 (+),score=73.60 TRINITY_DN9016_c0_g2_i1:91-1491(+)
MAVHEISLQDIKEIFRLLPDCANWRDEDIEDIFLSASQAAHGKLGSEDFLDWLFAGYDSQHNGQHVSPLPAFVDWGGHPELEVARTLDHVANFRRNKGLCILEPWQHVGHNHLGEEVRSSINVAHVAATIGLRSLCIPLWSEASSLPASDLAEKLRGRALVLEGGAPDVYDASTYTHACCPRSYLFDLYKRLLRMKCPALYICLSHQMAAACLVELVKDAIHALEESDDPSAKALGARIRAFGEVIRVIKRGNVVATGFHDEHFATAKNELIETELLPLHEFEEPSVPEGPGAQELRECLAAHTAHAHLKDGQVIEKALREDTDGMHIAMFHGVEVNYEAMMFAHWALEQLVSARAAVPWLAELPVGVEVIASTKLRSTGQVITEVACMRIDYDDGRSVFTCQFHPELCGELRDARFHDRSCDTTNDGPRLLRNILKHLRGYDRSSTRSFRASQSTLGLSQYQSEC